MRDSLRWMLNVSNRHILPMPVPVMGLFWVLLVSAPALAQQPIGSVATTINSVSTGTIYTATGAEGSSLNTTTYEYRYGSASGFTNNKVFLSSLVAGTVSYVYEYGFAINVKLKRVNNAVVATDRDLLYSEGAINAGQVNINAPYVASMTTVFVGNDDMRSGTDNLFGNQDDGNGNNNNIERLDVHINGTGGYLVGNPNLEGFAVLERGPAGAHDPFVVSVITSLDGAGNPNGYTTIKRLSATDYGSSNVLSNAKYVVLRRNGSTGNLRVSATPSAQGIGGIFFRFADFGITAGTKIYGYSLAGADFPATATPADMINVNNAANFPTNTSSSGIGGLDFAAITGVYRVFNNDLDAFFNDNDIDDDNDGIPDLTENGGVDAYADADGDGVRNYVDATPGAGVPPFSDANADGVNDAYDADKDGRPNQIDLDSDNDGIPDLIEAGGVDINGDGVIDNTTDTDADGLANTYDVSNGGNNIANLDTDGDGIRNFLDLDSDNDGIPDVAEVGGVDADGDGQLDNYNDADSDGYDDTVDGDLGNDGIAENSARSLLITGADGNNDGRPDIYPYGITNIDGRGLPNPYDLDSDDDGIADVIEAGGSDVDHNGKVDSSADSDKDGFFDSVDGDLGNDGTAESTINALLSTGADANNDGKADGYTKANADSSGGPNPYDLDADNDGIPDLIESGGVDSNGDGRIDDLADLDNNGWLNRYDPTQGGINLRTLDINGGGVGGSVFDFDGDGIANFLDLDSDNDGIADIIEQGGTDGNNDGKVTTTADVDVDGFDDSVDALNNTTGAALGTPLISTGTLINAFNLASSYSAGDNFDGTGGINMLDLDGDGDGILDVREVDGPDSDGDGRVNGAPSAGSDANGWSNIVDGNNGGVALTINNTDASGSANYLDIDSDDDGITDNVEGQATTSYTAPANTDADADGLDDQYDNNDGSYAGGADNGIIPVNTDGADLPDYLDEDADNDILQDRVEGNDFNGNGSWDDQTEPLGVDSDADGLDDRYESSINNGPIVTIVGFSGPGAGGRSPAQRTTSVGDRDWRRGQKALPVRFLSINAKAESHLVQINWIVTDEREIKIYEVEKSIDGVNFIKIGEVPFKMVNSAVNSYQYTDAAPVSQKVYYRVRQVDLSGTFTYSRVIAVVQVNEAMPLSIFPNPVSQQASVMVKATINQSTPLLIIDMQGRTRVHQVTSLQKGMTILQLDTFGLAAGEYFLYLVIDGKKQQLKFIKQ